MAFISNKDSYSLGSLLVGVTEVGVWIVVEEQYQDALKIIYGAENVSSNPITNDEMDIIEKQANQVLSNTFSFYGNIFFSSLLILGLITFVGYIVYLIYTSF